MGFTYVGVRVTDLERSVRFYTEGLGLREQKRGTMSHGGVWVSLVDPKTERELELNWYPPGSPFATPFIPGDGLDHLGFDVEDARATIRDLVRHGGKIALEPWLEKGTIWIGFVTDPDGNWLEIESPVDSAARPTP
jgi:lactoylglutathione lyase